MKKRKPPVLLMTCLIIFCAVAGAFTYVQSAPKQPDQQQAPKTPVSAGQSRPTTTAANVAAGVAKEMSPAPGGPGNAGAPPSKMMGMMRHMGPSIALPKPQMTKPVPSDTTISGQWYTNEARYNAPKGEGK